MSDKSAIRQSPIVIIRNLIAMQFAASGLYFLAASLVYFAQLWRGLGADDIIPFQIAQIGFLFLIELLLVFYIFFAWWRNAIIVKPDQVQEHSGLLWRKHAIIPRVNISSVSFHQGLLGKLTNYGTVVLHDAKGRVLAKFHSVADPEELSEKIVKNYTPADRGISEPEPLALVRKDEHEQLERKSTLRWDMASGKVNHAMERSAMKTVAAFLNSNGGHLLIGVDDAHKAVGLEYDYATLSHKDVDGFINHFGNIFNTMLGAPLRHLVQLRSFEYDGKECMLVAVSPSPRPAYLSDDGKEEFFIRTGNGTTSLKISEVTSYIETRWGTKQLRQ